MVSVLSPLAPSLGGKVTQSMVAPVPDEAVLSHMGDRESCSGRSRCVRHAFSACLTHGITLRQRIGINDLRHMVERCTVVLGSILRLRERF